jgi:hypothetical protein
MFLEEIREIVFPHESEGVAQGLLTLGSITILRSKWVSFPNSAGLKHRNFDYDIAFQLFEATVFR